MRETNKRTVAKALTWRIVASILIFAISFITTGSVASASIILSSDIIIKTIMYYLHERLWAQTSFGMEEV